MDRDEEELFWGAYPKERRSGDVKKKGEKRAPHDK
jgi:hypothetical protein